MGRTFHGRRAGGSWSRRNGVFRQYRSRLVDFILLPTARTISSGFALTISSARIASRNGRPLAVHGSHDNRESERRIVNSFDELNLIEPLQRALREEKYETPTDVQAQTIPHALAEKDVLACAQTGTGKTAAFALPILNRLGQRNRKSIPNSPHVLILAPTRELAIQIGDSFATYGRHLHVKRAVVYGGVSQANQVRVLNRGAHVLIATPGRLIDLMNQGHVKLSQLEVFVLDEADRMLDMGFLPDLKRIISELPENRQSLFFSATLPQKIVQLSRHLLTDPVSVDVAPQSADIGQIEQRILFVENSAKRTLLHKLLAAEGVDRTLVFAKTKRRANDLAKKLVKSGIRATAIHGNKTQSARQRALDDFRKDRVQVLVATDVAARGIDVDGITHVINYDLPMEAENYVHRIGRTGRAGASGVALSFCGPEEHWLLQNIEREVGHAVDVDKDHPRPEGVEIKPMRRPQFQKRRNSNRPGRKRTRPSSAKGDSQQRRRPRRKGKKSKRSASSTSAD